MPELAEALADDAASLAVLHDRELTADTIAALRAVDFPFNLGVLPARQDDCRRLAAAVADLPAAAGDELAAEYAAVYLTGAYGVSPCESVWLDEDRLICGAPMFALREIYAAAGLAAADWRQRPDDHLALQLLYLAAALRRPGADGRALAQFLDAHLLRWLPDFAAHLASRGAHPFYAALAAVTAAWCEAARDLLRHP